MLITASAASYRSDDYLWRPPPVLALLLPLYVQPSGATKPTDGSLPRPASDPFPASPAIELAPLISRPQRFLMVSAGWPGPSGHVEAAQDLELPQWRRGARGLACNLVAGRAQCPRRATSSA
jgi:hypothetical protein